ncbi:RNA-directed DNA polymerase, eukaryota, reverse transcriptase zinc-binding domain protein [Tanacetum coccineum]
MELGFREAMNEEDTRMFVNKMSNDEAIDMVREVSDEEIKLALFDIEDDKSSGSDGFTSIHWYFHGGRGLRQGDPVSPYLFTLVMEILNLFLKDEIVKERNFKYHFACDLLVLCHEDTTSVMTIKKAFKKFSAISSLYPNLGKSTMFCGSLNEEVHNVILSIMPFMIGKLPVKYLGVPLVDKKLGVKDSKSLIDKVKQKLGDWKNKSFYYAGRVQLIAYLTRGKARVALKEVCSPKSQGGLGLNPLEQWNSVLLVKHLWNIATRKESLWIGNGKTISVCVFNDQCNLSDLLDDNGWRWPTEWRSKTIILGRREYIPRLEDTHDIPVWITKKGNDVKFSTNQVWKDLREDASTVNWEKLVCFSTCIPRHTYSMVGCEDKINYSGQAVELVPPKDNALPFIKARINTNERKCMIFKNEVKDRNALIKFICDEVRAKLMSLKTKKSKAVSEAGKVWEVQFM